MYLFILKLSFLEEVLPVISKITILFKLLKIKEEYPHQRVMSPLAFSFSFWSSVV